MTHIIILDNMDDWDTFAADNRDALVESYASTENALQHACQGGLTLGGGAAPMFQIMFSE